MIDWMIFNAPYAGVFAFGWIAGVVFAAHRQLRREREARAFDRWMRKTRSV